METQLKKNCRIGARVKVSGKEGVVVNSMGEIVIVRFDDGSFVHANDAQVEVLMMESYAKSCSFCKSRSVKISKMAEDTDNVYQCMSCSRRFSHN